MYLKLKMEHSTVQLILVVHTYTIYNYIVLFCPSVILVCEKFKAALKHL